MTKTEMTAIINARREARKANKGNEEFGFGATVAQWWDRQLREADGVMHLVDHLAEQREKDGCRW